MLDHLIKNATLIDGAGGPARRADVGVSGGRIVAVGEVSEEARQVHEADGLVLCPGFVDPHTHYDAQVLWDPHLSPSNLHGVTTIISGNCGFTLAPLRPEDAGWTLEMMAEVEGMPLAALKEGVGGDWQTFGEYLDRLEGNLGVNAAFLVGHCALRRFVMGASGTGNEASPEQVEAMKAELRTAIEAGALGFSSSQSFTHNDGNGHPVPSRSATTAEVLELCGVVSEYEGTTLEYITDGCLKGFTDEEIERLTAMSLAAQRPLNWNVLTVDSQDVDSVERQLEASAYATEHGARIVALTMPMLVPMNMSFLTRCRAHPDAVLGRDPHPSGSRTHGEAHPEVRRKMVEAANSEEAGVLRRMNRWADYTIGDTYADENKALEGRKVGDIAAERGQGPFDALVDIVLADDLRTVLWPEPLENDEQSWKIRMEILDSERAMIGGSDAGAHLDRMLGSVYPTVFLDDTLHGRKLVSLERAVQLMTDVPSRLFGLRERGRIEEGWHADMVLFDPDEIGCGPVRKVADLPAESERLFANPSGIRSVWVNGRVAVVDNEATEELAGDLLRSGRDTATTVL